MASGITESLIKYLSGLLDADGCLSFSFTQSNRDDEFVYVGLKLNLSSSEAVDKHGFVESLPKLTGMGAVYKTGDRQQFINWQIAKRSDLEMILPRVIKHMVIKAKHWQWMLETWRYSRGQERGQNGVPKNMVDVLAAAATQSRKLRVGPLRAKNYPTWAWLAGYLDGDGCYSFDVTTRAKKSDKVWRMLRVNAVAHERDASVLEFLQNSFGGVIRSHSQSDNIRIWYRQLGPSHGSFAVNFLARLAKHSRLKRHKIDQMIHYHRQRLSVSEATA